MGYKATGNQLQRLRPMMTIDSTLAHQDSPVAQTDGFSNLHKEIIQWIRRLLPLCMQPFVTWTDIMDSSGKSSRLETSDIQLHTPDSLCVMRLPKAEQQDIFLVSHSESCRVPCIQYIFQKYSGCNKKCPLWLGKYPKLSLMTDKFT